jgi:hypothetical protein
MPVTLAQAQLNTQADVDYAVIDNLRRYSWLLDQMVFDDTVTPGTGGSSLTYGYTRLVSASGADFRAVNTEYSPTEATRQRHTVELKPLGGAFQIDRILARLGQRDHVPDAAEADLHQVALPGGADQRRRRR